jgi:hypothetical protein
MKVCFYFVFLYFGFSMRTILCDSRDDLIERLLQETTELRKENIKVWEKN